MDPIEPARSRRRPLQRASQTPAEARQPVELKGVPVLVVDDDAANAKLFAVILEGEGCVVKVAHSAEDAIEVLRTFRPRAIVLDLILPLMSGLVLAERLKTDASTADIVLIAVTSFNGPGTVRLVHDTGFATYVRKPIDPLSFAQLIAEHLGGDQS